MKKRIALLLAIALMLSCVTVLISCNEKCSEHIDDDINEICDVCGETVPYTPEYLGFAGYYNTTYENETSVEALSNVKELYAITDFQNVSTGTYGNIFYIRNNNAQEGAKKFIAVNLDTESEVYHLNREADLAATKSTAELTSIQGYTIIVVETETVLDDYNKTYTKSFYTALGVMITSVKRPKNFSYSDVISEIGDGYMEIDGKIYKIEDDVASYKFDKGLTDIPDFDMITDKYVYDYYYDSVRIYDTNFEYLTSFDLPVYFDEDVDECSSYILANGNLIIQISDMLPGDASEYDFMLPAVNTDSGEYVKYDLRTIIFDIGTKSANEIDFNYVINDIENPLSYDDFEKDFIAKKVENVAYLYGIVDKYIDYNNEIYASLRSSDLRIIGFLGQEIPDQDGLAYLVDTNRFMVRNKAGNRYLLNEKGAVLGRVDQYISQVDEVRLFVDGNKYYDTDLNLVTDKDANDYTLYDFNIYRDIISRDQATLQYIYDYYLFYNGVYTKLAANPLPKSYYKISSSGKYLAYEYTDEITSKSYTVIMNEKGEKIFTIEDTAKEYTNSYNETVRETQDISISEGGGKIIIKVTNTTTVNYSVTAKSMNVYIAE